MLDIFSPFKFTVNKLLKVRWGKPSNPLTPASGDSCFVSVMVPFAVMAACDASFTFMCVLHQRQWVKSTEEVAVRHIVTEICQTPLSHSVSVCLSLCLCIYKNLSISELFLTATDTSAGWDLPAIVTIVLGKVVIYSYATSLCAHTWTHACLHTSTHSKSQLMHTHIQC